MQIVESAVPVMRAPPYELATLAVNVSDAAVTNGSFIIFLVAFRMVDG
jgi:hypothetical protein